MGNNDTGTTYLSGECSGINFGGMQFGGVGSYYNTPIIIQITGNVPLSGAFAGTVFGDMNFSGIGSYPNSIPAVTGANLLYDNNFFGNMQFGGAGTYYNIVIPINNNIGWGFII